MNKKKIAFVIPSLNAGGMERVISEQANYIATNTQTDCHLILYGKSREIFYEISQDIKVYRPSFEFDDKRRQWMTVKTMKFIRSTIRAIKPDSALSFGEMWNSIEICFWFCDSGLISKCAKKPDSSSFWYCFCCCYIFHF
jgi:GalNAc-alpha-(1->4)-GalNAc-alpha-(1->3)-diNAcBac-PP-undecaprenol alpha-1,4-N-acetyl-D-galactosaminyltransferase